MAHLLTTDINILKVGSNVFRIRDKFNYIYTYLNSTGPNGICFDPTEANNRFFVCNLSSNTVTVFNATTLAVITTLSELSSPTGIAFDPNAENNRFAVTCGGNNSVVVYDSTNFTILSTI
jgi:YVTN family beta-propeller protein